MEFASNELAKITGCQTAVDLVVKTKDGLTQQASDVTALTDLHQHDLPRIESVRLTLGIDAAEWSKHEKAYYDEHQEYPSRPSERVLIHIWSLGTELDVEGDDRTRTQGLAQRLAAELAHGAVNDIDGSWAPVFAPALAVGLGWLFYFAAHWVGLATYNKGWEAAEIVAALVGLVIGSAIAWAIWRLFPQVEFLAEGEPSRFRRFRTAFFTAVGALVIGIAGSAVWAAVS